ncbi:hypothetical protein RA307_05945 [Xanthobacteraceae bacterium Astr-EGSB]|nr:hypothetical protein [Xanthobacteraceae bacterium Astr-EGSB]
MVSAERAGDRDFPVVDVSEYLVALFVMSVRSDDVGVTVEDRAGVLEIDAVNQPVAPTLILVPAEGAYACKQPRNVLLGHRVPRWFYRDAIMNDFFVERDADNRQKTYIQT